MEENVLLEPSQLLNMHCNNHGKQLIVSDQEGDLFTGPQATEPLSLVVRLKTPCPRSVRGNF